MHKLILIHLNQFESDQTNLLIEQKPVLDFSEIQDDVILEMAEVGDLSQRNRFAAACWKKEKNNI